MSKKYPPHPKKNSPPSKRRRTESDKGRRQSRVHEGVSSAQSRRIRMNRKKMGYSDDDKPGSPSNTFLSMTQNPKLMEVLIPAVGMVFFLFLIILTASAFFRGIAGRKKDSTQTTRSGVRPNSRKRRDPESIKPDIREELLSVSKYNRPGIALPEVRGIVIHYVQNPGSSAEENRRYFENLAVTHEAKASSHFIVGLEGEILQLVPLDEIAYCSNDANSYTISIECCHPDKTGKFNEKTYESATDLAAWLCALYKLDAEDVIRHYDVTGKRCPAYYVDHEDAWEQFRQDVVKKY